MSIPRLSALALISAGLAFAQAQGAPLEAAGLAPQTVLPISFTKTVSARRAKPGDVVTAKTVEAVTLANGQTLRRGAEVLGHVVNVQPFSLEKTLYAGRGESAITIQFDALVAQGQKLPLHVYLRAIADPFATSAALEPRPSDEDPLHSTTQVGGDTVSPPTSEIVNFNGDTVGYSRREGNFAHLVASRTSLNARCDASNSEQPVSIFSASACGAYGFRGIALTSTGYGLETSQFSLASTRRSPEILRYSSALLEVLPDTGTAVATR